MGLFPVVALFCMSATVRAQPTLEIHSESRLRIEVARGEGRPEVRVDLRDDLGGPIADAPVRLSVDGEPLGVVRSDARGTATLPIDARTAIRPLRAEFDGTPFLRPASATYDPAEKRARVELVPTIAASGRLPLDEGAQTIRVHARSSAGAAGLRVRVRDEEGRVLAESQTDALGRAHLGIAAHDLGSPGPGRLVFESDGTETHRPASTSVPVVRTLATLVDVDERSLVARPGARLVVRGTLQTERGPLADEAITLVVAGREEATSVTDEAGRFELAFVLEEGGERRLDARVRFDGSPRGADASESDPIAIEVRPPFPSWPFVLLPLTFVAALFFARKKRLERPAETAPRRPLRTLFDRPSRAVRLRVRAARAGLPVAGAQLRLGDDVLGTADGEGRITTGSLPLGRHVLEVEASGFVRRAIEVTIPARAHDVHEVILVETREAATRALSEAARRRGVPDARIAAATHREIGRSIERVHGELDDLVDDVDRAYYGPEEPSEEDVRAIEERTRHLSE